MIVEVETEDSRIDTIYICDRCEEQILNEGWDVSHCGVELDLGKATILGEFIGKKYSVNLCVPCGKHLFFRILPRNKIKTNRTL